MVWQWHPKSVGWKYLPFHFFNSAIHSVQLCQLQSNSLVTQNYFIASVSSLYLPGYLSPNTLSNFSAVFHHCLPVVSIVTKHSQIAKHVHVVVIFSPINFDLDIHILLLYTHLKCFCSISQFNIALITGVTDSILFCKTSRQQPQLLLEASTTGYFVTIMGFT